MMPVLCAYDTEAAQKYAGMFEPVQGAKVGKALSMIAPDDFVKRVKKGEPIQVIDIRTPAELGYFGVTMPGVLSIPINELFKPENLENIPTDKRVVVVCRSGTRATAAATGLRYIGFFNVYVLKGGIGALTSFVNPKTANMPLLTSK